MKYKIIISSHDKAFTYKTDSYEIDKVFISFTDDRGTKRKIPISRIIEVVENG